MSEGLHEAARNADAPAVVNEVGSMPAVFFREASAMTDADAAFLPAAAREALEAM